MDEDIKSKVNENAERLTRLEKSNAEAHTRIEGKVDHVIEELRGMRYMAKGAKYTVGFLFAVTIWIVHEWEVLKRFFTR
ncbi:MAG: hypothetical protein PVI97_00195 [Candidatus Thiodiazotropha sp.]